MRSPLKLGLLALALAAAGGCATHRNENSLRLPCALFGTTVSPLVGDFGDGVDVSGLKKGTSEEILYFFWPYPNVEVTVGDETLKAAMKNGGLTEMHFADCRIRRYLILTYFSVDVYGR